LSTATRNWSRSSGETTYAHADQGAGFKLCCLRGKRFDGAMRKDYFR
jgi:hypothetical protein